jgi:hypothetical protein
VQGQAQADIAAGQFAKVAAMTGIRSSGPGATGAAHFGDIGAMEVAVG